jgi:hypothetical protein
LCIICVCGWRWPHVRVWLAGDHDKSRALEADSCDSSYWRLDQLKGQQNPGKFSSGLTCLSRGMQSRGHLVMAGLTLVGLHLLHHHRPLPMLFRLHHELCYCPVSTDPSAVTTAGENCQHPTLLDLRYPAWNPSLKHDFAEIHL